MRSQGKLVAALLAITLLSLLSYTFQTVSIRAQATTDFTPTTPQPSLFLDMDWYRANLISANDEWNGGLDGDSGMAAYQADFNGFFHMNLDRQFRQTHMTSTSSVAQSRGIYMNVESYRAAEMVKAGEGQRFLDAAVKGADFLLQYFRDPDLGGYYWAVSPQGIVADNIKQGYGNVHPILALAQAYSISHNPVYLQAALDQLKVIQQHFLDPDYPGGILPGFNRDFSQMIGVKNVDTFTHYFESLLTLYDVTEGQQQQDIADLITTEGNFLTQQLYHDQDGFTDRGYVAYNYDQSWQPSQQPYTRQTQWSGALQATPGHGVELAYLLSRAVERGFNPEWLTVGDKLLKFCLEYAIDPQAGGMIYEVTDYQGKPLDGNPDNLLFIWWAQAETARALLDYTVVRNESWGANFKAVETLFNTDFVDPVYGGLYYNLDITNQLQPGDGNLNKGDIWKANYHQSMFFAEVLRLAQNYPDRIAALNAGQN
ncbi:MAG: AGE family epimerase/isomerase [Chloroflexota bacterium]